MMSKFRCSNIISLPVLGINMFVWGKILGTLKVCGTRSYSLIKLNDAELAIIWTNKRILILKHVKGCHFEQVREISACALGEMSDIDGYGRTVVALGGNGRILVPDCVAGKTTASFKLAKSGMRNGSAEYAIISFFTAGNIMELSIFMKMEVIMVSWDLWI